MKKISGNKFIKIHAKNLYPLEGSASTITRIECFPPSVAEPVLIIRNFQFMISKRFFLIVMFSILFSGLYAQKGLISGSVADSTSGEPVSFATIALIKPPDTNSMTGTVSDEAGIFSLKNIPNGRYRLMVSFIGYESRIIEGINISSATLEADLGEIKLRPAKINLETVEVTGVARTASQKIDRQTYRASDFETVRG
jgi:hypothetical protein